MIKDYIDVTFAKDWEELLALVALAVGALLGVSSTSGSALVIAFLAGLGLGAWYHKNRKGAWMRIYGITLGFIIGYTLGSLFSVSAKSVIALFALGFIAGFILKNQVRKK